MIITENEKTKVCFSNLFYIHYPELYNQLRDIIWSYHRGMGTVSNTKDYWVRDFMPIQVGDNSFVRYTYNPDYLQGQKKYITDVDKVLSRSPFLKDKSIGSIPLVVDGGNMVLCKGHEHFVETNYIVMSEKVLCENPQLCKEINKDQIRHILQSAFQLANLTIVWLPWDKKDIFGHTDGIVKYVGFIGNGKPQVLVNLNLYDDVIANQMRAVLNWHFDVIDLKLSHYDELSWAYINCLQTKDFIIIPGIGDRKTDQEAVEQYNILFPQYKRHIYQVQMRDFIAENGGALNCLTWTTCDSNQIEAIHRRLYLRHKLYLQYLDLMRTKKKC